MLTGAEFFWQIRDYLQQGGWIMFPLLAVSVVMWTMIVERWREFRRLTAGAGMGGELDRSFQKERSGVYELDREILRHCALRLGRNLDIRLAAIAVLAGVAPLLGLLGTVLGMIQTFEVISVFGTGNARAMAGGISVALITTQTGLLVAIPGLLMSNRLGRMARSLQMNLDEASASLARNLSDGGSQ
ncbi:MAG: MotA/TolQ/ExbB proton channel family protein [Gemmatimonadales bacterium]|nr:MotA/TolQ/ExbB proton channel family protein [Gemmatimonadales bacterium]